MSYEKVLSQNFDIPDSHAIDVYLAQGGYKALPKVLKTMTPEAVMGEVKKANLRGRGGAGFPAGVKWGFVPKDVDKPKYLCVNADEGEPGTYKDRQIMEKDPHMLIEGIVITCYAVGIHAAYIYIRGEFVMQANRLEEAIREAYDKGYLGKNILETGFDLDVHVHRGAGAYVCGEETALIESLEGKKGQPRLKPPFPAVIGLFNCPTVINNVETVSNVPHIINKGGDWFTSLGVEKDGGNRLFGISGHVVKPGVYELPTGISLKEVVFDVAGGIRDGHALKAVIPGGSSTPVLKADEIDIKLDIASVSDAGSMLGSGAIIVMDDSSCMVHALMVLTRFYHHESCGQCTPCREGTGWLDQIVTRIETGQGREGDIELLESLTESMTGTTICPLSEAAAIPVQGFLKKFRGEFEQHIAEKGCPKPDFGRPKSG